MQNNDRCLLEKQSASQFFKVYWKYSEYDTTLSNSTRAAVDLRAEAAADVADEKPQTLCFYIHSSLS